MSGIWIVSYVLLWTLALSEALLLAVVFRQLGLASLNTVDGISRDGLPIGTAAPSVDGLRLSELGRAATSTRATLLVFASTGCRPCQALMPDLDEFLKEMHDQVQGFVIVASNDSGVESRTLKTRAADVIRADGAADSFRVRVTPFAFLIGVDGRIQAKGLANNREHLAKLWRTATAGNTR